MFPLVYDTKHISIECKKVLVILIKPLDLSIAVI